MAGLSKNDAALFEQLANLHKTISDAQFYVSENFGVLSDYDNENAIITVKENDNNLKRAAAKQYFESHVDTSFIDVIYE